MRVRLETGVACLVGWGGRDTEAKLQEDNWQPIAIGRSITCTHGSLKPFLSFASKSVHPTTCTLK